MSFDGPPSCDRKRKTVLANFAICILRRRVPGLGLAPGPELGPWPGHGPGSGLGSGFGPVSILLTVLTVPGPGPRLGSGLGITKR